MTYRHDPNRRPARVGTREESAQVLAALRRRAGLEPCQVEGCDEPARDRFGALDLCSGHAARAMIDAYACEVAV